MSNTPAVANLPTEIKAHIVSMVNLQEKEWRRRIKQEALTNGKTDTRRPGDSLHALSLVSKEFHGLACPYIFDVSILVSSQNGCDS